MEKDNSYIGTGWGFPPEFNPITFETEMVSEELDIQQSLEILLSTIPGERILRSDYGCDLTPLLFESITTTLTTKIRHSIEKSIALHEPRIQLDNIYFTSTNDNEGIIEINIEYIIKNTNSRFNFTYPYYIKEGTHIAQ